MALADLLNNAWKFYLIMLLQALPHLLSLLQDLFQPPGSAPSATTPPVYALLPSLFLPSLLQSSCPFHLLHSPPVQLGSAPPAVTSPVSAPPNGTPPAITPLGSVPCTCHHSPRVCSLLSPPGSAPRTVTPSAVSTTMLTKEKCICVTWCCAQIYCFISCSIIMSWACPVIDSCFYCKTIVSRCGYSFIYFGLLRHQI